MGSKGNELIYFLHKKAELNRYVAYNIGKSNHNIKELIGLESFPEEFTYKLPSNEIASKYIAIGGYNGSVSIARIKDLTGKENIGAYDNTIDYLSVNGLVSIEKDRMFITPKGFRDYGAVFSLLYCIE